MVKTRVGETHEVKHNKLDLLAQRAYVCWEYNARKEMDGQDEFTSTL